MSIYEVFATFLLLHLADSLEDDKYASYAIVVGLFDIPSHPTPPIHLTERTSIVFRANSWYRNGKDM